MRKSSLTAITNRWPQLNADWLITGEGEMVSESQVQNSPSAIDALISRIDKLIEVQERQSRNMERLLEILVKDGDSEKPRKRTSSL